VMGQDKTIELIRRNFWWPKMDEQIIDFVRSCAQCQKGEQIIDFVRSCAQCQKDERIIDYVRSCADCQKDKAARHQPYGLLNPLELAYSPWQSIAIDFIADLPLCEGCDQLWVVINQFTKMAHFLPLQKDGKTASDLAKFLPAKEIKGTRMIR